MSALEPHGRGLAGSRLIRTRQRLEDAVEQALAALDALDGDPDHELDFDGEDGADDEPDRDGDGRVEHRWQISGRAVGEIDGAEGAWHGRARRQLSDRTGQLDLDDAPDPLQPPRYGYAVGVGR